MNRKQIIGRKFLYAISAAAVLAASSCSVHRLRDRYDEEVLNYEENRYNLYLKPETYFAVENIPRGTLDRKRTGEIFSGLEKLYSCNPGLKLKALSADDSESGEAYSMISICWEDHPPILRFWQRLFSEKSIAFTCPLDKYNSRLIKSDDSSEIYEVFVSLRQSTILPWIVQDDYEIFRIICSREITSSEWGIDDVEMLTDNRSADIQPVLNEKNDLLAYINYDEPEMSLYLYDLQAKTNSRLLDGASLPFFLPDSDNILFVSGRNNSDGISKFTI